MTEAATYLECHALSQEPGRPNTLDSASPTLPSDTTAALAIHAPAFAGSLTIRNTIFTGNAFIAGPPLPQSEEQGGSGDGSQGAGGDSGGSDAAASGATDAGSSDGSAGGGGGDGGSTTGAHRLRRSMLVQQLLRDGVSAPEAAARARSLGSRLSEAELRVLFTAAGLAAGRTRASASAADLARERSRLLASGLDTQTMNGSPARIAHETAFGAARQQLQQAAERRRAQQQQQGHETQTVAGASSAAVVQRAQWRRLQQDSGGNTTATDASSTNSTDVSGSTGSSGSSTAGAGDGNTTDTGGGMSGATNTTGTGDGSTGTNDTPGTQTGGDASGTGGDTGGDTSGTGGSTDPTDPSPTNDSDAAAQAPVDWSFWRGQLLWHANELHPGLQEGPWADDMEAVVAVICKPGSAASTCSVQLEAVTFEGNTGVATSALYVLCDGGMASGACSVSLTDCNLRDNKLLWQAALDPANLPPPGFLGMAWDPEPGPGKKLLNAMVPWLTYTYPLLQYWKTVPDFQFFGLQDAANLPTVTGRTLGAVVVHSRNAPSPGLAPDKPPVLSVTVTGGEYSGNDGAALMGTATDWSRTAGGSGNWSDAAGAYFRHSADFALTGLNITGHMSGVPAVWLRWPRAATVSSCRVTDSNGGIWLDEVRDAAVMESSTFQGNHMPAQRWLWHRNFLAISQFEDPRINFPQDTGLGSFHSAMLQMTPQGEAVPNTATVSNCWFDGNPSFITGNLYVGGSDGLTTAKDALPGRTTFTLANTNFTRNYCRRFSGGMSSDPDAQETVCRTGERPFLSTEVHTVVVDSCRFENNLDGGAYIDFSTTATLTNTAFTNNLQTYDFLFSSQKSDMSQSGGALGIRQVVFAAIKDSRFVNNSAPKGDGGAIWVYVTERSDLQSDTSVGYDSMDNCFFDNNTAGALYIESCKFVDILGSNFTDNRVLRHAGGAIRIVDGPATAAQTPSSFSNCFFLRNKAVMGGALAVSRVYGRPGFHQAYKGTAEVPFIMLFQDNMASLGGAIYVRGTSAEFSIVGNVTAYEWQIGDVNETMVAAGAVPIEVVPGWAVRYRTAASMRIKDEQPIVFYNNTANGGGALYLEDNQYVLLAASRFIANTARAPPLGANFTGLGGRERYSGPMASRHCYHGGGGAVCVTGRAGSKHQFEQIDLSYNKAEVSGGGIYVADGQMCSSAAGCYSLQLNNTNMTGNTAVRGQGGAVFWRVEGIAEVQACSSDTAEVTSRNQTANGQSYNVTWIKPNRKPPAVWYSSIHRDTQSDLLSQLWNGSVHATANGIYRTNGLSVTTTAAGVVYLNQLAANINASSLPAADASGSSSTDSSGSGVAEAPVPPVPTVSVTVNDTAWMGLPHTQLACADWAYNDAVSGPDIGTTPYFLMVRPRVDFYSSNTPLHLPVSVHDWLGQNATGVDDVGALVVVTAVSQLISGATTVISSNGTADFDDMKLRGPEGAHNISFTGRVSSPERVLKPDMEECRSCPDNTDCSFPSMPADAPPTGYMVPADGYWHSSFYSEQVLECPNPASCSQANRSARLARLQFLVYQAGRNIQLNTSAAAADVVAAALISDTIGAGLSQSVTAAARRFLQAGQGYYASLLASTAQLLRDYMNSQCAPGYTGTLCGECAPGWGWVGEATCIECPSRALNNLYYALATLLTALSLAITVNAALRAQRAPETLVPLSSSSHMSFKNGAYTGAELDLEKGGGGGGGGGGGADGGGSGGSGGSGDSGSGGSGGKGRLSHGEVEGCPSTSDCGGGDIHDHRPTGTTICSHLAYSTADRPSPHATSLSGVPEAGMVISAADCAPANLASAAEVALTMDESEEPPHQLQHQGTGGAVDTTVVPQQQQQAPKPKPGPVQQPPNPFALAAPVSLDDAAEPNSIAGAAPRVPNSIAGGGPRVPNSIAGPGSQRQRTAGAGAATAAGVAAAAAGAGASAAAGTAAAPPKLLGRMPFFNSFPRAAAAATSEEAGLAPRTSIKDLPACSSLPRSTPRSGTLRSTASGAVGKGHGLPEEGDPVKGAAEGDDTAARDLGADPDGDGGSNPPEEVVEKKLRTELPTIIRIFLAYLQVLAMLKAVPIDIPHVVDIYYGICSQATSYPGQLVSLDCSLPDDLNISPATTRTILAVLAPFYSYVIALIIFLFANTASFVWKKHFKRLAVAPATLFAYVLTCLRGQLLVTLCTVMFFYYPSVVQALMTIYNCVTVDSAVTANPLAASAGLSTDKVWSQDYGMVCYQGEHLALALGLGLPGLLIIGMGWPIISAMIMTSTFTCGGEGLAHSYRSTAEIKVADYKPKWIWWESAVMLRQLAIAAVVTFVSGGSSPTVQLLVVFCILTLAAVVQTIVQPYRSVRIGYLALVTLYVLLATVYLLLYLPETSESDNVQRVIISVLIVVMNAAAFSACIWYILRTYWHGMLMKSGLKELDREARHNLTYAQARQLIKDNIRKQQGANGSNEGRRSVQTLTKVHRSSIATATATAVIIGQGLSKNLRSVASTISPRLSQRTASSKAGSGRYNEGAAQSDRRVPEAAGPLGGREGGQLPTAGSVNTSPAGTNAAAHSPPTLPGQDQPTVPRRSADLPKRQSQ
ncbi:hypothetical protein HXX76_004339 [Chlamydomonas incerta]|uniref:Right handed beta helix domain-containing protein n=1 Tax=Chlamydomonas incerta TaxID=51695 RepID=A0A835T793_CHLIN|nr:hypothetical protein HXX76_004339 [Chlamydomonas incerta]|eukprot:KAG2440227.1 hypothetical protein HXX76_004339 [Chlamydomonas incerta]